MQSETVWGSFLEQAENSLEIFLDNREKRLYN